MHVARVGVCQQVLWQEVVLCGAGVGGASKRGCCDSRAPAACACCMLPGAVPHCKAPASATVLQREPLELVMQALWAFTHDGFLLLFPCS